jgi:hypothetical protein
LFLLVLAILLVVAVSLVMAIQSALAIHTDDINQRILTPLSVFTTRNNVTVNTIQVTNSTLAKFGGSCPPESAIYIHGFWRDEDSAGEEFDRIQRSLNHNNYRIPLVGFSWDSKTDLNRIIAWNEAKIEAKEIGPELAKFIKAFKDKCPDTHIRLIAHSLGAAVINSTLVSLDNTQQAWENNSSNNNSKIIRSIHLLGAAINNTLIAKNTTLGNATEHMVDKFYNLYNPQDDGLLINQIFEKHDPLGLIGAPSRNIPVNYNETNVAYEIPPFSDADGDGNLEECFEDIKPVIVRGDNHCGYMGFRQPFLPSLIDDGAIDIVVRDWIEH